MENNELEAVIVDCPTLEWVRKEYKAGSLHGGYLRRKISKGKQKKEHRLVMSRSIGRELRENEVVHHRDEDKLNNRLSNLQLFENAADHIQEHVKMRAFKECGNRFFRLCSFCKKYDSVENMNPNSKGSQFHHKPCLRAYNRDYMRMRRTDEKVKATEKAYYMRSDVRARATESQKVRRERINSK